MHIIGTASGLAFNLELLPGMQETTIHAQTTLHNPEIEQDARPSERRKAQSEFSHSLYHIVEVVEGICRRQGLFELLTHWLRWEEGGRTWDSIYQMNEDITGLMEDYFHTTGDWNLKRTALSLCF